MFKNKFILFLIFIIALLLISNVSAQDNATFADLSQDINSTTEHQTLELAKDYKNTDGSSYINITKSITINGNGHVIDANNRSRIFWIKADDVMIRNLTFANANAHLAGGSISWWGNNATLADCTFVNSTAVSGGGALYFKGNDVSLTNCNFENNRVNYGAAVSLTDGAGFDPSMIHIPVVNAEGGAVYINGDNSKIENCSFSNNEALLDGGAISTSWGNNVTISKSKFKSNRASYYGGALDLNGENVTVDDCIFISNSAGKSNDIFINSRNNTIMNSNFENESNIDGFYDIIYVNVTFKKKGTFDELAALINNSEGIVCLETDYEFTSGQNKGIIIDKSIVIDGCGHTLDGKKLSRMFNVTADNVTIRNINFINGNCFGRYFSRNVGGGAIYWTGSNGRLEMCNFTNNTGWGVEDDPFDGEESVVDENGTVIHVIRVRPMGAKINEGGAVVWNGTNGIVSKCIFTRNSVGYPNLGGAICWRGACGIIIDSEFYNNDAWCGAAVCWVADNGTILTSKFLNWGISDQGIFWFGQNGCIRNSLLLSTSGRDVIHQSGATLDADYNFWGDTIDNPNRYHKSENVTKWIVLNLTSDRDYVIEGERFTVDFDLSTLTDDKGNLERYEGLENFSYKLTITANTTGFVNLSFENGKLNVSIKSGAKIVSKDLSKYYKNSKVFKVRIFGIDGKIVPSKKIKFKIHRKVYYAITDEKGYASIKISEKPGKYTIKTKFGKIMVRNKVIIKTVLITKNVSKKLKKSAKFSVKVLDSKGKAAANKIVKIKFKGKTYKIKSNRKGIAAFSISKNLKAGRHAIKTSYMGLTNSNMIKVK